LNSTPIYKSFGKSNISTRRPEINQGPKVDKNALSDMKIRKNYIDNPINQPHEIH